LPESSKASGVYFYRIDIQMDSIRLRRKIDSLIEPPPFREKDFDVTNPIVNEISVRL